VRLVFFGTPEIAVPSLDALHQRHEIAAVVCQPDKPRGRGRKLAAPPTKVWAEEREVPVHQPSKLNDGTFEAWLKSMQPDLCAVAAFGRMIKEPLLNVPPKGYLNMHPSMLPRYRGPSPIQSAILNGDETSGVTIMKVTLEMDAGDILLQQEEHVLPEDTSATLGARLAALGGELLARGVDLVEADTADFTPQDPDQVVYCRKFEKQDGMIRWDRPSREIHNVIRAAIPWPVAFTLLKGETYRIHKSEVVEGAEKGGSPGMVIEVERDRILVHTGDGVLALLEMQAPGKRALPVRQFLLGRPIEAGDQFGGHAPHAD
jgi:methionyl-tRNA formyltransferase